MKLLKKILLVILALLILLILYVRLAIHEGRPTIEKTGDADALAQKILQAVDANAWDTLAYVTWTFPGGHTYVWDKIKNDALITWNDFEVHLDMDEIAGRAFKNSVELQDKAKTKAIQKAWSYWCNDSYWLSAPYKIFDTGTTRELARDADGTLGLLVSYSSGGVTPGDQYLWYTDDSGRPTGYKMWVSIIPIGGVYASWDDWKKLDNGATLSSAHKLSIGGMMLKLTGISGGQSWDDVGYQSSPIKL